MWGDWVEEITIWEPLSSQTVVLRWNATTNVA